ncbi:hypothetical protein NDU88_006613 [Pleurodeles waltl]|uniref:Uncharacterized protein n=1 Tax=Pleurodeles waltl TaxID=8319 RepID=A0AAV7LVD6_PLEWA|nr:hypothetical protein NDU88_006613 [Pleurodeles waltl]
MSARLGGGSEETADGGRRRNRGRGLRNHAASRLCVPGWERAQRARKSICRSTRSALSWRLTGALCDLACGKDSV